MTSTPSHPDSEPSLGLLHDAPLNAALTRLAQEDRALPAGALERLTRSTTPLLINSAATTRPPLAEAGSSSRRGLHTPRLAAGLGPFRLAAGVGVAACVAAALLAQRGGTTGAGALSVRPGAGAETRVASVEMSASDTALLDALFPAGDDDASSSTTGSDDLYAAAESLEDGTPWDLFEWASEATQQGAM